jgi:hypothetical protein
MSDVNFISWEPEKRRESVDEVPGWTAEESFDPGRCRRLYSSKLPVRLWGHNTFHPKGRGTLSLGLKRTVGVVYNTSIYHIVPRL